MAVASPARVRFSGFVVAICAVALGVFGYWMVCLALNWTMPDWVPEAYRMAPRGDMRDISALPDSLVGQGAAYLSAFAALLGLNAVWMLVFGRRNWLLLAPMLLMFVVFIGAVLIGTMRGGAAG